VVPGTVTPHFMFGSPVAAYIQYCILKCPLVVFGNLLRNPGNGLDSATALDTGMQRQDKTYVASCL